jgi:hypothetical protein
MATVESILRLGYGDEFVDEQLATIFTNGRKAAEQIGISLIEVLALVAKNADEDTKPFFVAALERIAAR